MSEQDRPGSWRYAVRFAIEGDVRFLSHHDVLRLLTRAFIRAGLPLRYSGGFNPGPKLVLPVPRPVGVAGLEEWLLVQLDEPVEPAAVCSRLAAQVPEGVRIEQCRYSGGHASWQAQEAFYELDLPADLAAAIPERIAAAMASESVMLTRQMGPGKPSKSIDVRRFVRGLELRGERLAMQVLFDSGATVRPGEVLEMLGVPAQPHASRVQRVRITWGPRDLSDEPPASSQSRPIKEAGSDE